MRSAKPEYTVQVLKMGSEISPSSSVFWNDRFGEWTELNYYAVLIQGDGHTILLNTGLPVDYSRYEQVARDWCAEATVARTEEDRVENALQRLGIVPDQVDTLLFTPLTVYTTGRLSIFLRARYWLSRRGWTDYWAPDPFDLQLPRDIILPPESIACLAAEGRPRISWLEDEGEIYPGLEYFWTGGHHRSSVAYLVRTAKGIVGLADCCFKYENIQKNIPIGLAESYRECLVAYDRLRRSADILIPLYDPEVLERYPGGCVA
jgi:glyoxylase-like metal-dependent hydrolase (beta-lactamase superfamily II)